MTYPNLLGHLFADPSQAATVGAASNRRETVFAPKRRETVFFAEQPSNSGQGQAVGDSDLMTQLKNQVPIQRLEL